MSVEKVTCPNCKQKLAIFPYTTIGSLVVCANLHCGTSLRILAKHPVRVEAVSEPETYTIDYRPESYG